MGQGCGVRSGREHWDGDKLLMERRLLVRTSRLASRGRGGFGRSRAGRDEYHDTGQNEARPHRGRGITRGCADGGGSGSQRSRALIGRFEESKRLSSQSDDAYAQVYAWTNRPGRSDGDNWILNPVRNQYYQYDPLTNDTTRPLINWENAGVRVRHTQTARGASIAIRLWRPRRVDQLDARI